MEPTNKPLAVLTGASSGIGYELAKQFASNGYDLLVVSEEPGIFEAQKQFATFDIWAKGLQIDLANYEGVEKLVAEIQSLGRPVDVLVLNAGVGVGGDFTQQTNLKDELNLIELNITSVVHLAKRVLPGMVRQRRGRVLITSSIAATMPAPFEAIYGASKAFLYSFAEAIRNELKDSGVTVTTLMPGPTETNFFHRAGLDETKVGVAEKDDPAEVARDGFEALMAGKDHIIAGSLKNKVEGVAAKVLPETAKAQIHRKMAEPGSANRK
jgi:short-subunit dehydrogenase